jgi:DNA processing protein
MPGIDNATHALLRLTLTPGLGPTLIARLLQRFGSADEASRATAPLLQTIEGIGPGKASKIIAGFAAAPALADAELTLAQSMGIQLCIKGSSQYPPLLAEIPNAPPILYIRGDLRPKDADRYPVALVGSRACSHYGLEQSKRFAGVLARSGLTVVSGGARGIDSAAHRGAIESQGRTVAVLGCGLAHTYPPENGPLFDDIAQNGAVVSELPLNTPPVKENFPARNRIISGLSLGVLVIEAAQGSGALITARQAVEEHGREVMALPGRVDSEHCQGSLALLKSGGAALVTDPGDVIAQLESSAHHTFKGTHEDRFAPALFSNAPPPHAAVGELSPAQHTIIAALRDPKTFDTLCEVTNLDAANLRVQLTLLELQRRIVREGALLRLSTSSAGRENRS